MPQAPVYRRSFSTAGGAEGGARAAAVVVNFCDGINITGMVPRAAAAVGGVHRRFAAGKYVVNWLKNRIQRLLLSTHLALASNARGAVAYAHFFFCFFISCRSERSSSARRFRRAASASNSLKPLPATLFGDERPRRARRPRRQSRRRRLRL